MDTEQVRIAQLAAILAIPAETLGRHLIRPLPPPMTGLLRGWVVPEICRRIFAVADGFRLFGTECWDGFKLWDSQDYDPVLEQSVAEGLFPIFGEMPHLVSISTNNGAVVASDWEDYRRPEQGWGEVIAPDLQEYIRTLIHVREAYGDEDDMPSDWWHPYASDGSRYDLEED